MISIVHVTHAVHQVTVVTADGSVLVANENENTDLFWGVRGGGSNFGIVTEFVFKLHPQREKVFAGPLIFPPNKVAQVGAVLDQWWASAKPESGALVGLTKMHGNVSACASTRLFLHLIFKPAIACYRDYHLLQRFSRAGQRGVQGPV